MSAQHWGLWRWLFLAVIISLTTGWFTVSFDLPTLLPLFSDLQNHFSETVITHATTPKGRFYDHVFYKGFDVKTCVVDTSVVTDHYPVLCSFTV